MKLTLGFSPCPNDCFIFDAIINKRIDLQGIDFEFHLDDVETLNRAAFRGEIDITKLSFHAFAYCMENYFLLDAGAALGRGCGPLLVSKREISEEEVAGGKLKIAIPGKYTTANLLMSMIFPKAKDKTELVFSEIENAVLNETVDAGLIIHENRFTYQAKGLKKIMDLGEFWEAAEDREIPLGAIVMKRSIPADVQEKVNAILRESVEYAFAHPEASMGFVKAHAQEMSEQVMLEHIRLYVNEFSIDLGEQGKTAIRTLYEIAYYKKAIPLPKRNIFFDNRMQK